MRTTTATFLLGVLMSGISAFAQSSAVTVPDPYGIITRPIPDKTVVLSFDDACVSHATFVAPLLKDYGFGATFYITEAMGFQSRKDWYMTWDQIKGVQDMGFEIGNHTVNHWGLSAHTLDSCIKTTAGIEEQFRKHGIARPTTFCWPMYRVNNAFVATLSERGYLFARGGHERVYDPLNDCPMDVPSFSANDDALKKNPDVFRKAAEQAKNGKIAVFCFHGVPDGEHPQVGLEPGRFREMMSFLRKNAYNVISMRDLTRYVDPAKAALYLSRPLAYPWGGRALAWGWVSRKADTLYIGIDKLPADRKLPLPGLTTPIARAWFLADAGKKALPITTSDKGISTIAVPRYSPDAYGTSPVIIAAKLHGCPVATILDFCFPGLPAVSLSGDEIRVVVPEAANVKSLAPVYHTGSPQVTGKPASGTPQDFSGPREYTISAPDGKTRTYTVRVTKKPGAVGPANPSFETFDSLDSDYGALGFAPKGACWTFTQANGGKAGIVSLESPHLAAIAPLDGSRHCAVVGGDGGISQSVVFDEGKYTIRFDRTVPNRVGGRFPSLNLTLDGRVLLTLESVTVKNGWDKKAWKRYTSPVFTVTAGPHTIGFANGDDRDHSNYGLRGANFIDNVQINRQGK